MGPTLYLFVGPHFHYSLIIHISLLNGNTIHLEVLSQ